MIDEEKDNLKNEVLRLQAEIIRLRIEITQTKKQLTVPKAFLRKLLNDSIKELNAILDTLNGF